MKQIPAKVPLSETLEGQQPKQVHVETRRLMHVFRMSAHRAESGLRELFRTVYPRWRHESRELVRTFLNSAGDLEVLHAMPMKDAIRAACRRLFSSGRLKPGDAFLTVALLHRDETQLHAGVCADGGFRWVR